MPRTIRLAGGKTGTVYSIPELRKSAKRRPAKSEDKCECKDRFDCHARFEGIGKPHRISLCPNCGSLLGLPVLVAKSEQSDDSGKKKYGLGKGERWITLHPDPDDPEHYVRVIIRTMPDGTGMITRSPEGKLNYMKLTKLRSPAEWKESAKRRREEIAKKEQERLDSMSDDEKRAEGEKLEMVAIHEVMEDRDYVVDTLNALGIEPDKFFTPKEKLAHIPSNVRAQVEKRELKAAVRQVDKMIAGMQEDLRASISDLQAEELNELPIEAIIPPVPIVGQGKGYVAAVETKAKEEGLTPTETAKEKEDLIKRRMNADALEDLQKKHPDEVITPDKVAVEVKKRMDARERLAATLAANRELTKKAIEETGATDKSLQPEKEPDVDTIIGLVKRRQDYKKKQAELRKVKKEVKKDNDRPDASLIAADETKPEDIAAEIESKMKGLSDEEAGKLLAVEMKLDQMQAAARQLAEGIEEEEGRNGALSKFVGIGRYNSFMKAFHAATGQPLFMDRITTDILGVEGTAQVLAQSLSRSLTPEEFEATKRGVVSYHQKYQQEQAEEAYNSYDQLTQQAAAISIPAVGDTEDLAAAQVLANRKADLINEARETLGQAYGELQAVAELVKAMEYPRAGVELHIPLGEIDAEQAIGMARLLGLNRGELDKDEQITQMWEALKPSEVQAVRKGVNEYRDWLTDNPDAAPEARDEMRNKLRGEGKKAANQLWDYMVGDESVSSLPDYRLDTVEGGDMFLTVRPHAIEKLTRTVDTDRLLAARKMDAIREGKLDEKGWLPAGIVSRPLSSWTDPDEAARKFTEPLSLTEGMGRKELREAVEEYVGGRLADGIEPAVIRSEITSALFRQEYVPASQDKAYWSALSDLGFASHTDLQTKSADQLEATAQKILAKKLAKEGISGEGLTLHSQSIPEAESYEAIHRVLARMPEAKFIYTPVGEMTPQDKETLRLFFWRQLAKKTPPKEQKAEDRTSAKQSGKQEDEVGALQMDIFGGEATAVMRKEYSDNRKEIEDDWSRYVSSLGGTKPAYEAIQAVAQGKVMEQYAREIGRVTKKPLKTGHTEIPHWEDHIIGLMSPAQQRRLLEERFAQRASEMAQVARRSGGKFAKEVDDLSRKDKAELLRDAVRAKQLALFEVEGNAPSRVRVTIGRRAEEQMKSIFPYLARAFDPKTGKIEIPQSVDMTHGKHAFAQRFIRMFMERERLANSMGTGSGKTLGAIGSFTQLHHDGKVKRSLNAVPTSVQGQFGGEMARFTEPGKYKWHAKPGAPAAERRAAYADQSNHMVVVTHQALRDDLTWALAKHRFDGDAEKAEEFLRTAPRKERSSAVKSAMQAEGWNFDMAVVDEGHNALNRKGKPNSHMANALDAMTDGTRYYMPMSADPVKNDVSEAFDLLRKLDPDRYTDWNDFKNRFGLSTSASRKALQRELAMYQYNEKIPSSVKAQRHTLEVSLSDKQREHYDSITKAYRTLQRSRGGSPDVEAAKLIAPHRFEGKPESEHAQIASDVAKHAGFLRNRAYDRVVNEFDAEHNAKLGKVADWIEKRKDEGGKQLPGIVFASELAPVRMISDTLRKKGLKVETFTGEMGGKERDAIRNRFQAQEGNSPDVIVLSDAGSTGIGLQKAAFAVNFDTPNTAMTHEQRIARMERQGQVNPDIQTLDVVTKTPYEYRRRRIMNDKMELRDILTAPTEALDDTGLAHEIFTQRYGEMWKDVLDRKHREDK